MNKIIKIDVPIDITFNMENLLEDAIKEAKSFGCQYQDDVEEYIENGDISVKVLYKNIIKNNGTKDNYTIYNNISNDDIYNAIIHNYDNIIYHLGLSPLSADNFKILDRIFSI